MAKIYYFVELVWNQYSIFIEWRRSCSGQYLFDSEHPNVTQMWQLLMNYVYSIITDIPLWFSVPLPITTAWHCHFLCAALLKHGVCELAHPFFHFINLHLNKNTYFTTFTLQVHYIYLTLKFIFHLYLHYIYMYHTLLYITFASFYSLYQWRSSLGGPGTTLPPYKPFLLRRS